MSLETNMINIGTIMNTFGTRGFVKLVLKREIEVIGNLADLMIIFYKSQTGSYMPLRIESIEQKEKNLLIKIIDFDNINDVLKFKHQEIFAPYNLNIFTEALNFTSMKVITENDEGIVTEVMNNGAQDLIMIKLNNHTKEFWVPVVDAFVESIDEELRIIRLYDIEGLK